MAESSYEQLKSWCKRIIDGDGGLKSYRKNECSGTRPSTVEVVEWTIRCLGNPKCEGSRDVLEAILDQREFKTRTKKR